MSLLPFRSHWEEVVTADLADLSAGHRCPMCRYLHDGDAPTRYCCDTRERSHFSAHPAHRAPCGIYDEPHLHRTCQNCGYEWHERVHNSKSAPAK